MSRGEHLTKASFATGGGPMARLFTPGISRVLDRIDAGLAEGGIDATLPDGSRRLLGGRTPGPLAIVHLRSWRALVRLATSGSVGWYQAWAAGEWWSPDPVPLFDLFMRNAVTLGDSARAKGGWRLVNKVVHLARRNSRARAPENIAAHYDLGNDFYAAWLDPTMTYSSALWDEIGHDLTRAQQYKIDRLLDRLSLASGDRLLEIGCGWGSLAIAAARRGASVVGLTLSAEQKAWADRWISEAGLSHRIEIRLQDYRDVDERFDAVASVEMVEAVGQAYWGAYLDSIARALKPGGRAALQFIHIRAELFDSYAASADFIQAYVFPGGMLLHEPRFAALAGQRGLSWQDRSHGFGIDYAETLRRWRGNYDEALKGGRLAGFSETFHDLWRYYLMYCEGGFRAGGIGVAQVTLVKG